MTIGRHIYILGISAFNHDSSACLLKDGEIVAAVMEERFTRKKHDSSFPEQAIDFCLQQEQIRGSDLTLIIYFEKPLGKFKPVLRSYIKNAPEAIIPFIQISWIRLRRRIQMQSVIGRKLGKNVKQLFALHHESHAASVCFTSHHKEGAFLIMDALGEDTSTSIGYFKNSQLKIEKTIQYPHSLGLLYSAFTEYCGFKVNSGEYKLMGLAPFGNPVFVDLIERELFKVKQDLSFELNLKYFRFHKDFKMTGKRFEALFGQRSRKPENNQIDQHYKDVAASIQLVLEKYVVSLVEHITTTYQTNHICLSGGVALNCAANGKLVEHFPELDIWIQPAADDSGCSLGAALLGWCHFLKNESIDWKSPYLGPDYSETEIVSAMKTSGVVYRQLKENTLIEEVCDHLLDNQIVGWFQGKSEWGPRALGNRSILANPTTANMKDYLNSKIKKRESFRPFAPVVLEEYANEWFEMDGATSPYMTSVFKAKKANLIPACVHLDNTSRVQTVNHLQNNKLANLLKVFHSKTGVPVLINTSFNERGEPIVNSPTDAIRCFFNTGMDVLILENYIIVKKDQHVQPKTVTYEAD